MSGFGTSEVKSEGVTPPAGWYADPGNPFLNRLWDGTAWTQQTAPSGTPSGMPVQGIPTLPQQDLSGKAKASMILGLVGILAWILPIVGLPVTITGLVFGIRARNSSESGKATAGMVLCSIFLFVSLVNAALGAYLRVTGRM